MDPASARRGRRERSLTLTLTRAIGGKKRMILE